MSRIKFLAADALRASLATEPTLTGVATHTIQQPPDRLAEYPAICVMPERFPFQPCTEESVRDEDGEPVMVDDDQAVVEVGQFSGSMRIWVGAIYPPQREVIEDAIMAAFNRDGLAPGRLLATLTDIPITGVATDAAWPVGYILEDTDWREEMAFSEQRFSMIQVAVDLPVLALRQNAWLVQQSVIAMTSDLSTEIEEPDDLDTIPDLVQIAVDEDGDLSAFP